MGFKKTKQFSLFGTIKLYMWMENNKSKKLYALVTWK